tara:strand:+ start:43 stop:591 length:549 start_codon:yes stop_codon:yes gene_type:complete
MATTKERLEQIENALLVLAGGGAGYSVARQGVTGTARAVARPIVGTPQGRAVLAGISYSELVQEINERDRELARSSGTDNVFMEATRQLGPPIPVAPGLLTSLVEPQAKKTRKKAKSKFNRAVSAGMKAVKNSKSYGKKGTINNAKRAFSAVTKVASKVNRGKKVSAKGVTGTIARAVRKIL